MGYTIEFQGEFRLNRPLDYNTHSFLQKLAYTRRMKRDVSLLPETGFEKYYLKSWGVEGEFYVDGKGFCGQEKDNSVIEYNYPPSDQPGLWCQWIPTNDGCGIIWDGNEKFYNYIEWLKYIIKKILSPRRYVLNGEVKWQGERPDDFGKIRIESNAIFTSSGKSEFDGWEEA